MSSNAVVSVSAAPPPRPPPRTHAEITAYKTFRMEKSRVIPRDNDGCADLASEHTFIEAIMGHPKHGPWWGALPNEKRPLMHESILSFLEKFNHQMSPACDAANHQEAWDEAFKQLESKYQRALKTNYSSDFTFEKFGRTMSQYSADPVTGELLFAKKPVQWQIKHEYKMIFDFIQDGLVKYGLNTCHNKLIMDYLENKAKTDNWLLDKGGLAWDRTGKIRGGWAFAIALKNYPRYYTPKEGNNNGSGGTAAVWWPNGFTFEGMWNALGDALFGGPQLQAAVPTVTVNAGTSSGTTIHRKRSADDADGTSTRGTTGMQSATHPDSDGRRVKRRRVAWAIAASSSASDSDSEALGTTTTRRMTMTNVAVPSSVASSSTTTSPPRPTKEERQRQLQLARERARAAMMTQK